MFIALIKGDSFLESIYIACKSSSKGHNLQVMSNYVLCVGGGGEDITILTIYWTYMERTNVKHI